jgi:hypothetical protein
LRKNASQRHHEAVSPAQTGENYFSVGLFITAVIMPCDFCRAPPNYRMPPPWYATVQKYKVRKFRLLHLTGGFR